MRSRTLYASWRHSGKVAILSRHSQGLSSGKGDVDTELPRIGTTPVGETKDAGFIEVLATWFGAAESTR